MTRPGQIRARNTLGTETVVELGGRPHRIHSLAGLAVDALPYSLRIVLENLLRHEDGERADVQQVQALLDWGPDVDHAQSIALSPSRTFLHDTNGVPTVVDIAAMRHAMVELGGDPVEVNPQIPAELVIDHSVIADVFGTTDAFERNVEIEYQRNLERYAFLKWGQRELRDFAVVPPGTGIMHQVNCEHLARVVESEDGWAFPDICLGTDSHTTMVNGMGVLAWGIGGIEAEAVMLGESLSMLLPPVVGFQLHGELPEGTTATDLVLTITQQLRAHGVVGKFVEFHGPGVAATTLPDRLTISNMSPEFGSTCAYFPIDDETLRYLRFTGRSEDQVRLVEDYAKHQGLWHQSGRSAYYSERLSLDLATVVPSIAGPRRPQDRVLLTNAKAAFRRALPDVLSTGGPPSPSPRGIAQQLATSTVSPSSSDRRSLPDPVDEASAESFPASDPPALDLQPTGRDDRSPHHEQADPDLGPAAVPDRPRAPTVIRLDGHAHVVDHGHVAIAAITSCTNTSNPSVMVAAGLLARNAVRRGLRAKPWVKTSLSPGSKTVTDYLDKAGLTASLDALGFHLAGYGCMTCIGASGPLIPAVTTAVEEGQLAVAAVLSGNRNFDGRINPDVRMNYLASPPLVVAYALAGTIDHDLTTEPLGTDAQGRPVHLADIWPSSREVQDVIDSTVDPAMFHSAYADVFTGDERWQRLPAPAGDTFAWDPESTYLQRPPYLDGMTVDPAAVGEIRSARVLVRLGDSVTTDHISPAGAIPPHTAAGAYLLGLGVERFELNTYASRRGNHQVMMRGCFANVRLRNMLVPGTEGGYTRNLLTGETDTVFSAAMAYRQQGVPLVVVAGKEYGTGSSRDWAAKGPALLGVKAVLAESFERIHRSNLIGMGILPLQFEAGQSAASLGITGDEPLDILGIDELTMGAGTRRVTVRVGDRDARMTARIDTARELDYYRHGGITPYVVRELLRRSGRASGLPVG